MFARPGIIRGCICAVVLATGALSLSTVSAQAQWFGHPYRPPVVYDELTPREMAFAVVRQGYRSPSQIAYRGDFAAVNAIDADGRPVRLALDIYSGRIVNSTYLTQSPPKPRQKREQIVQRVPDQGAVIRNTVPDASTKTRATSERPSIIKREPLLPPQGPVIPKKQLVTPEKPAQPAQPPQATVGSGTKNTPRRIEFGPPAELDAPPLPQKLPTEAPINSVPPAALE